MYHVPKMSPTRRFGIAADVTKLQQPVPDVVSEVQEQSSRRFKYVARNAALADYAIEQAAF